MLSRNSFIAAGMLSILLGLSACASKPVEAEPPVTRDPVAEAPTPEPVGPVPGSLEDLKQNVGNMVYFGYDQYNLTPEAQATLARQAAWLQEYPETRIRIAGNCDERGTREYNLALGARRANAAKNFLVSQGVDPARITTISFGKERPIDPNSNEAAWSKNRNAMTTLMSSVGS